MFPQQQMGTGHFTWEILLDIVDWTNVILLLLSKIQLLDCFNFGEIQQTFCISLKLDCESARLLCLVIF